jgi:hypothetical protein
MGVIFGKMLLFLARHEVEGKGDVAEPVDDHTEGQDPEEMNL